MSEMAANCFGEVVNGAMLKEMGLANTKENRAAIAFRFMYNDDKRGQASGYVDNLKAMYGYGSSTLCLVYNASGDSLHYVDSHDWYGSSVYNPGYPKEIGNGQWAAFLHVHQQGAATGSVGAVVYRGKNRHDEDRDFLLSWCTPWAEFYTNKAYCEIGGVKFYVGRWDELQKRVESSGYTSNSMADGVEIQAQTERGTSPKFAAIVKQE
ncbi:hypothetical protein ACP70R_008708 [Stipagrostis hirtigluma subsp. patula]